MAGAKQPRKQPARKQPDQKQAERRQGPEINEDRRHQRIEWRMERVAWMVMLLLMAASLLGVFGSGPLSRAQAGQSGTLTLDYDRVQRSSAPTEYRFEAAPALARDGQLRLRFDAALLEEVELDSIVPEPETVRSGPGYTEFAFALDAAAAQPASIVFQFQPATFGHVRGRVATAGAPPLVVDQIVLP